MLVAPGAKPAAAQFATPPPSPGASPALPSPAASATPSGSPAGVVPPALTLSVTGNPAAPDFLQATISSAIRRAVQPTLQPGATLAISSLSPLPQPLQPGFETNFTAAVAISVGPETAPVEGTVAITVQNVESPPFAPAFLYFDDDPERITADGVVFRGNVDAATPMRLYYYHQDADVARRVLVMLSSDAPARVALIDASAGPNVDVMSVGHAVTRQFLLLQPHNEGTIADVTVPSYAQEDALAGPGQVVAGALDVRVIMGGPVALTVMAISPGADPSSYLATPQLPRDGHNRHGTFVLQGYGDDALSYTVGGAEASLQYGGRAPSPQNVDPADSGQDHGDYGVVHRITLRVGNPLGVPASLYLYERPLGGPVRSSFLVDGTLQTVGCVRVPNRYAIEAFQVAPQSTTSLDVLTMTDGGSNYPLEVGVTATPPLSAAPPIDAPDGCFPKPSTSQPQAQASPAGELPPAPESSPAP